MFYTVQFFLLPCPKHFSAALNRIRYGAPAWLPRITPACNRSRTFMCAREDLNSFDAKNTTLFQLQKLYNIWAYAKMSLNCMKGFGRRRSWAVSALPVTGRRYIVSSTVNASLRPTWLPVPLALSLHFTCICCTICLYVFLSDGECLPIVILIGCLLSYISLSTCRENISEQEWLKWGPAMWAHYWLRLSKLSSLT